MDIIVIKEPENILSGNAIDYQIAITPYTGYEKKKNIYILVDIDVELLTGSGFYKNIKSQKIFVDDNGIMNIDISSIVNSYLKYFIPPANLDNIIIVPDQMKYFQISFSLYVDNIFIDKKSRIIYSAKGGVGYEYFNPDLIFGSQIDSIPNKFLKSDAENQIVFFDTKFFLFFFIKPDIADYMTAKYSIEYLSDNVISVAEFYSTVQIDATKFGLACIPGGYDQLNLSSLSSLPADAIVIKYSIAIWFSDGARPFQEYISPIEFIIEQRNFYKKYQLLYRNCLGGLSHINILGQVDFSADYTFQQASKINAPSYIENGNILGTTIQPFAEEQTKYLGNTGFLSAKNAECLRDFFLSKERFEIKDNKLLPITINNKTVKFFSNKDNLISTEIEWQHAFVNNYFSDKTIFPDTCPAIKNFTWKQTGDNEITVFWSFPFGYNYAQVSITFPGEAAQLFNIEGNSGLSKIQFVRPTGVTTVVNLLVKAKIICNRYNINLSYGPEWNTGTAPLNPYMLPIANNDFYTVNASDGSAILLPGSTLLNDYDIMGNAIAVEAATGATTAGGSYSIDTAGIITYTPPSGVFTGLDTFIYNIHRVGETDLVPATITITVQHLILNTFAKIFRRAETILSPNPQVVWAEEWVDFFSDTAQLFPKTVTNLNVHLRIRRVQQTNGNTDSNTYEDIVVNCNGTKQKLWQGIIYTFSTHVGDRIAVYFSFELLSAAGYSIL